MSRNFHRDFSQQNFMTINLRGKTCSFSSWSKGRNEGYDNDFNDGQHQGYQDGHNNCYEKCKLKIQDEIQQAYEIGNKNGNNNGHEAGYDKREEEINGPQLLSTFLPSFVPMQAR